MPDWHVDEVPYYIDRDEVFVPVVDKSGTIVVLDSRTFALIPAAGRLPRPRRPFGWRPTLPRNCFDYSVQIIVRQPEKTYAGLAVASLPRQGAPLTLMLFDEEGRSRRDTAGVHSEMPLVPSRVLKGLVESLHPPVLTLASFFTRDRFDAGQSYRTLFFMPNSLAAQQRDRETGPLAQLAMALALMLPAVLLAVLLAWRVMIDAIRIGLPRWTRRLWLVATLAFGLPAFITYRLAHRRVTLPICHDCGKARRVDREHCHHCGKDWHTSEIDPPGWRVIDTVPYLTRSEVGTTRAGHSG